ncbi:MAG TPA: hypothetical protein VJU80_04905 [Solirubrobacteraceae bacterium]|nr:hypothetical protein [Solirubrobacteraceae bacterium]
MDGQAFLREVASLIECGWCRGAAARNCHGAPVGASDAKATAWSLTGALAAVSDRPEFDLTALRSALWGISAVIPDWSLDDWNDTDGRTQGDTLQMLAQAESSLDENPAPNNGSSLEA